MFSNYANLIITNITSKTFQSQKKKSSYFKRAPAQIYQLNYPCCRKAMKSLQILKLAFSLNVASDMQMNNFRP